MVRFLFGLVLFITCVRLSDGQPLGNHRITIEAAQMEQRILASIRSILPQLTSDTCGREKDMNSEYKSALEDTVKDLTTRLGALEKQVDLSALEDTIKNLTTRLGTLEERFDKHIHICKRLFEKVKTEGTVHVFEDRCYLFGIDGITWSAAQERCQLVGANLVSVMSKNQQDFIDSMTGNWGNWIGARRRTEDNKFAWIGNGLLLNDTYTNWAPAAQPDEDNIDFVITSFKGWFGPSSDTYHFICEL